MALWDSIKSWLAIILIIVAIVVAFYVAWAIAAGATLGGTVAGVTVAGTTFLAGWTYASLLVVAAGLAVTAFVLDEESAGEVVQKGGEAVGDLVGETASVVGSAGSSIISGLVSSNFWWWVAGGVGLWWLLSSSGGEDAS